MLRLIQLSSTFPVEYNVAMEYSTMTSVVTIKACVSDDKQVNVEIFDNEVLVEQYTLQNGQSSEKYVYDGRKIIVNEVSK